VLRAHERRLGGLRERGIRFARESRERGGRLRGGRERERVDLSWRKETMRSSKTAASAGSPELSMRLAT
jgi:hypothetical protein